MPWLSLSIAVPLLAALLCALLPACARGAPRLLALGATAVSLACLAVTWARFDTGRGMQLVEHAAWIPTLGVSWRVGVDGMSLALASLTVVLFAVSIVYGVGPRPLSRAAAGMLLLLEGSTLAFFLAEDFVVFYVAFDLTLVAMYFLIALWGEENRRYAAIKFFLYTLVGSLPVLLGIIALYLDSSPHTFDMIRLAREHPLAGDGLSASLVFLAFFVGFAIKTPLVPFHTWLPAAHVEAPTSGSVLLAGVLLKMGAYGLIRVNLQMLPGAFHRYALAVALLGLVSALYGALLALAQSDLKRLIAYTSINHMGYVVIGVAAAAATGISGRARNLAIDGAVLQMIAHGLVTGTLFFVAGFIKERAHTRDLRQLSGLLRAMPWYGSLTALAFFASLGLPGLAQFPAELEIFLGTFDVYPAIASVAVVGIVLTAALFLRALQQAFMGELPERLARLPDLRRREVMAVAPLVALFVALGLYPRLVLYVIDSAHWLAGGL
ncbi:NuoM family protein [Conexibacter sp. DBS9H8]|uniref:complex I subunit 4 family protein n=1 Tax=Conexibacter sp. DBS9H8 TaxID=2937801 RepID=UPI00200F55C2|nr:NADH-quinone oxidoreductase subunit M [Conexibacter sp. DBS9H8]